MSERERLQINKIYIDTAGELHIKADKGEIIYRKGKVKEIIKDNAFRFKGSMFTLFENEKDPERAKLLESI